MPTSKQVARELKRTARSVARIPDVGMRAAVLDIRDQAGRIGGRFAGRQLTADVKARRRGYRHTAVVFGRPAGYWAIRTYGRSDMRVRRGRGFRIGGRWRASAGPAGPGAASTTWHAVFDYADRSVPRVFTQTTEQVLRRGSS